MNIKNDSKFIKPLPTYLVPFWVGFLIFLMSYFPALLFALPQDGQIVAGNGNIQQPNAQNMVINQSSNQMITNWQGFNIGQSESVQFNQPNSNSVALNRVIGQDPTAILGKLNANGQIFITNPSGVFFGPNSIINVGSLMATSLQISDQDFLNRNYRFTQDPSKPLASVINEGQINASGYIGLLGPRAENRGMLMANLGSIALGSGKAATMDFSGDGLINFAITESVDGSFVDKDGNTIENGAFNSGTIQADGGKVLLTAHTAQKMIRSVVNNTGVIRAQSVSKRNGAIYLEAGPNGTATNEGTLDASGTDSGETGGTVHILGDKVGQFGTAMIDVSGDQGGGEVLIGGDYQGKGSVQNASITAAGSGTIVKANAITSGNGGRVIYWADDTTRFFGAIEAKGGANSGDGGFVEVSGKQFLDFNGEVITTAVNGKTGTLLLDPDNIVIKDALSDPGDTQISGDHVILFADGSGTFNISVAALEALNATNDIVLQANNTITFQDLADNVFDLQTTSNNSATFRTTNGAITFNDTNDLLRTQGGAINFIAGGALTLGKLDSNGGNISLTAGSTLTASQQIMSRGGTISFAAGSTLSTGPMNSGGAAISLTGVGINVLGDIATGGKKFSADAGTGTYNQSSNVTVATAGGNATVTADGFNLLFGFTPSGGNIFGVPTSIVTGTFSFINGPSGGTISLLPKTPGKTICIATPGCNINLSQAEIISLKGKMLNVGALNSGFIKFGDLDLGHKKTNFVSGDDIFGIGSNIVFHNDFSLAAKENISLTSGSSIEAHVSGFNATFTALADSDRLNGGGFNLSSDSFIRTQGGNVNITGNTISPSGASPSNIITNGGNYNPTTRTTTFTSLEELLETLFPKLFNDDLPGVPEQEEPGELPDELPDLPRNRALPGAFPDATPLELVRIAVNRDQGNQASVLGDFLDNGGFNKPNC